MQWEAKSFRLAKNTRAAKPSGRRRVEWEVWEEYSGKIVQISKIYKLKSYLSRKVIIFANTDT